MYQSKHYRRRLERMTLEQRSLPQDGRFELLIVRPDGTRDVHTFATEAACAARQREIEHELTVEGWRAEAAGDGFVERRSASRPIDPIPCRSCSSPDVTVASRTEDAVVFRCQACGYVERLAKPRPPI